MNPGERKKERKYKNNNNSLNIKFSISMRNSMTRYLRGERKGIIICPQIYFNDLLISN